MNSFYTVLKRAWKPVFGLIIASAMFISSCDAVTGPDAIAGDLALSASRSSVKVGATIPIGSEKELALIGNDPAYPSDGDYQLGADLTLTGWTPICGPDSRFGPFTGTFDGKNYTITVDSFSLGAVNSEYLGIFAVLGGDEGDPSVSNLNVDFVPGPISSKTVQYVGGVSGYARDTAFSDITITGTFDITSGPITTGLPNVNIGGVSGFAASSSFINVLIEASFATTASLSPDSPVPQWEIWKGGDTFRVRAVVDAVDITGEDGLTTGGVAGYAKNTQFRDNLVFGKINAITKTQYSPVYVGGIVGFATGVNIDDSDTSVGVLGEGPGYNSAAGGVAGYITGSRVRDSTSEGSVELHGPSVDFGWDASWQVYAGGLVGYVGGSDGAPSLIEHSHATSIVYAYAPFPYAGGLVGYLYGYNDFTNPAKNGSTVKRSYATGNVRAMSQPDTTTAQNGDIPYSGGLVGYSSVAETTIKDSYATGSATAITQGTFAWAGGVVGGNANDAVVLRTYATGTVTSTTGTLDPLYPPTNALPGPAAGGIAGVNYYTAATLISKSVALNGYVYGDQDTDQNVVHRVAGSLGVAAPLGVLDDNYANLAMTIGTNWQPQKGLDLVDGADMVAVPPQSLYEGLGWDFAKVWEMTGTYPNLR
jgi:hypothetical protein